MPNRSDAPSQLWFPLADALPLVEHCLAAPGLEPDPHHGAVPLLRLMVQGDLFYLSTNAWPPLLVDPFDPSTVQRVYAIGHSHHVGGVSYPADADRHGTPTLLGSLPWIADRRGRGFGQLLDQLHDAVEMGCDWLVVTLDSDGLVEWYPHPTPHPCPAAQWRDVRLELFGVPDRSWPGQVATNVTIAATYGWLRPRFTREVAEEIAAAIPDLAKDLPTLLTRVQLTAADSDTAGFVGPDTEGFYRVATVWPWFSPDVLPDGSLRTGTDHNQPGVGLDCHRPANAPTDRDLDAERQFPAAEHALRNTAVPEVAVSGLAAAFTPDEVEALLITAGEAVVVGVDALSSRQVELATLAYALLDDDTDDQPPGGDRSGGASTGDRP